MVKPSIFGEQFGLFSEFKKVNLAYVCNKLNTRAK